MFVSLPTGYGKLLCYQILPVPFDALRDHQTPSAIIVVLVLIMKDQVSDLGGRKLAAIHVTSVCQLHKKNRHASSFLVYHSN